MPKFGSFTSVSSWIAKGCAGAVAAFMRLRIRPVPTAQRGFVHLPAAFITLLAAFIPFAFSMASGRLSCTALERRSFGFVVATRQQGFFSPADTPPPITHFEGAKNEDAEVT